MRNYKKWERCSVIKPESLTRFLPSEKNSDFSALRISSGLIFIFYPIQMSLNYIQIESVFKIVVARMATPALAIICNLHPYSHSRLQ